MAIVITDRIVVAPALGPHICVINIDTMGCCNRPIRASINQNASKVFECRDKDGINFSIVEEITFTVFDRSTSAELINKTLSGGDITLTANNRFTVPITADESGALTKGNKAIEIWVTPYNGTASNRRYKAGSGTFRVIDTRKHD
jgi:hypothetical protein